MDREEASRPSGNLPFVASTFVGRQSELAEVKRRMEATRLLTLTGPGGVGKTRLAIQAGIRLRRAFRHGVWLADLAALEEASRLADAVAAALGVRDQSARPAKEQLADHLGNRELLLILDNCEHLAVACAELVDSLLRGAAGLRVLATSRQPLGIAGEQLLTVDPLPLPGGPDSQPLESLAAYEAVMLLIDRATAVQPSFTLHERNREAVMRLCVRLDGLPLAIELAATRLRSLSVEQVADRLDDRFRLLSRGSPAALSRQQTLRALMDWSYDLCSDRERLLWAALSIFPADFDLDAVEGICAGSGVSIEPDALLLDVLGDLVAKSIVSARVEGDKARYRLLETIRQYGRDLLAGSGIEDELRRRHRDHYLALVVHSCETWCGPHQAENLTRLRVERENIAAALDWSLAQPGESKSALLLVSGLRYHWTVGGFLATGRRRLEQVLAAAREPARERGDALWVAAWVALLQGDADAAASLLRECEEVACLHADEHLRAHVLILRGSSALFAGDPAQAAGRFAEGIQLMRKQRDPAAVLWGLFQHSVALSHCGDSRSAQRACAEAIDLADQHGEVWARGEAMWACGFDQWLAGDPESNADALVREALAVTPNANHVSTVLGLELLAWIAGTQARHEDAVRLLGAAASVWESLGTTIDAFGPVFSGHSRRCRASALTALGEARFRRLVAEGRACPYDPLGQRVPIVQPPRAPAEVDTPALTRRERQVAELIAEGLTNKSIATKLVVSRRTVDGHVERLFAKLDVTTRAQVAGWVAKHRDELTARGGPR